MRLHLIEGEAGCDFAVRHQCVAVVVDALRASATAAYFLEVGASELLVVREVADAFSARNLWPNALLAGERGGLPPDGFDLGNSPLVAHKTRDKRVVFTTTTGAGRLVACWGAPAVYMGTTVNASTTAAVARSHDRDIVLIPAGLMSDPAFDAQEDWVAASIIAMKLDAPIGEGAAEHVRWTERIRSEGVQQLFETAPHAEKLRAIGLGADIRICAHVDALSSVPRGIERNEFGVVVRNSTGL